MTRREAGGDRLSTAARAALLAFIATLLAGGLAAAALILRAEEEAERIFASETAALGDTVARGAAQQIERALALGIPLSALPGLEPYLNDIADGTPGIVAITLTNERGAVVAHGGLGQPAAKGPSQRADVVAFGVKAGEIVVATSTQALPAAREAARLQSALVVTAAAALAAIVGGLLADRLAGRPLARLRRDLRKVASRQGLLAPDPVWARSTAGRRPRAVFLSRVEALQESGRTLESYAAELRRADYDGSLEPGIEAVLAEQKLAQASGHASPRVEA